ncbi:MAG: potassium transporter TrkA [Firmicutes bacterium HGW-Firmicutes-13]|nr:MAG: potassium transporter TrkA [Firmicutes bacterium HGW-Firmicutes-13]
MRVAIVGGGKVGYYLVKTLLERNHTVILIEKDPGRARKIAEETGIVVINGDGSSLQDLKDAEVDQADVLTVVTGKDQDNLISAQIARGDFHVPRVIARVNNPKNEIVFQRLGLHSTVNSTGIISNLIEAEATTKAMKTIFTFHRGAMTLVEVTLKKDSPVTNHSVEEIAPGLPENCVLISVLRGEDIIFPRGDTMLQENDALIAVTAVHNQELLERALLGSVNK